MKSTELYVVNLYRNVFVQLSMGKASAMAWIFFLIIVGFSGFSSPRPGNGFTTGATIDFRQPDRATPKAPAKTTTPSHFKIKLMGNIAKYSILLFLAFTWLFPLYG